MKDFTVIMPCYILNEELITLTQNAVTSLGDNINLIIIDNASPLGGGYLRSVSDIYIRNQTNLGFARAVNQGLRLTKTKYIAIANDDIRISPNWQEVTKEVFKDNNTYSCHFRMTDYEIPFEYGHGVWYGGKERWCTSSFFVIKSYHPFLFDENYLNSYEDWDYWKRVRDEGFTQAYTNKAVYQHHHSYTQKLILQREENNKRSMETTQKSYLKKSFQTK